MTYGYNRCEVTYGPLLRDMSLEDFYEMFDDQVGCGYIGFSHNSYFNSGYMITEYEYGCQSPVDESWPLFLIPGMIHLLLTNFYIFLPLTDFARPNFPIFCPCRILPWQFSKTFSNFDLDVFGEHFDNYIHISGY